MIGFSQFHKPVMFTAFIRVHLLGLLAVEAGKFFAGHFFKRFFGPAEYGAGLFQNFITVFPGRTVLPPAVDELATLSKAVSPESSSKRHHATGPGAHS